VPLRILGFFGLFAAAGCLSAGAERQDSRFLSRSLSFEGEEYRYQVYVPADYSADTEWPIVLFLHGSGERGNDGVRPTKEGIGPAIRHNPSAFPAIVVFPQARRGRWWDRRMLAQAVAALDAATAEFHGDPKRTYLTGVSMGGAGSFLLAADQPDRFAALIVIAGFARLPWRLSGPEWAAPAGQGDVLSAPDARRAIAERISRIPVRLYHGTNDRSVPVSESQQMAEALRELRARVEFTEYMSLGHNAWDRAYAEPDLMPWLLSQHR
jgi:predicted peptidase